MLKTIIAFSAVTTFAPCYLGASTISTSTTCQVQTSTGPVSATDPSACSIIDFGDSIPPRSMASNVYAIQETSTSVAISAASHVLTVAGGSQNGAVLTSSAEADLSLSELFSTAGPMRSGIIRARLQLYAFSNDGGGNIDATTPFGRVLFSASPDFPNYLEFGDYPITLGTSFPISIKLQASNYADGLTGGTADTSVSLSFSIFESDGVTPVQIAASPEPASAWLFLGGILLIAGRRCLNASRI